MVYFPYSNDLQQAAGSNNNFNNFEKGNFGLWFNKFVPLKNSVIPKASDSNSNDNNSVDYYKDRYKTNVDNLLEQKHVNQFLFCKKMEELGYKTIVFHVKLKTPLITGIGESHPHEIGMVFDHTMGVPYIPSSGLKGVSKLNYIIENINDFREIKENIIDLESNDEFIKSFGSQDSRGEIIFLDAYSLKTPKLKTDVMTPHYGDYYKDGVAPADNQSPNPIKFLAIKEKDEFVFRVLVLDDKAQTTHQRCVATKAIMLKVLEENGIGAKTALGYGLFEIIKQEEPKELTDWQEKYLTGVEKAEIEKQKKMQLKKNFIAEILTYNRKTVEYKENEFKSRWENEFEKDIQIAKTLFEVVRDRKKSGEFYLFYKELAEILGVELVKEEQSTTTNKKEKELQNSTDDKTVLKKLAQEVIDKGSCTPEVFRILKKVKDFDRKLFKTLKNLPKKES